MFTFKVLNLDGHLGGVERNALEIFSWHGVVPYSTGDGSWWSPNKLCKRIVPVRAGDVSPEMPCLCWVIS